MHTMLVLMQLLTPMQSAKIDVVVNCSAADSYLCCTALAQCKHRGHFDCLQQSRLPSKLYDPSLVQHVFMECDLQSKFVTHLCKRGQALLESPALLSWTPLSDSAPFPFFTAQNNLDAVLFCMQAP